MEFQAWPKINRHKGVNVIISEKIDGTNACINIDEYGVMHSCQSRTKIIGRHDDNFGFANWAWDNQERIQNLLGAGRHYGEWAGPGIQKNPLNLTEKTFFLFNTYRWYKKLNIYENHGNIKSVPLLYEGPLTSETVGDVMDRLAKKCYSHQNDNMKPEGIVLFYPEMRTFEKFTFEYQDGKWKG